MTLHLLAKASLIAVSAAALAACGGREKAQLEYTYQKQGVSERQLLDDEQVLRHTSGVVKVFTKFDKGRAELQLFVDERNKVPGLEKALDLGYQQIHD